MKDKNLKGAVGDEIKICSNGVCQYRSLSNSSVSWLCNYGGYCDYQRPRDSRKAFLSVQAGATRDKLIEDINTADYVFVDDKSKPNMTWVVLKVNELADILLNKYEIKEKGDNEKR